MFSTWNEGSQGGDDDMEGVGTFGVMFGGLQGLSSPLGAAAAFTDHIQPVVCVIKQKSTALSISCLLNPLWVKENLQ